MPEDYTIDKARSAMEKFHSRLYGCKSYDDYREFVIRYFYSQSEKETFLNIIGMAEHSKRDLPTWDAFNKLFRTVAFREFAKKMGTFNLETVQLGFLLLVW
jgi:hypothetical protein